MKNENSNQLLTALTENKNVVIKDSKGWEQEVAYDFEDKCYRNANTRYFNWSIKLLVRIAKELEKGLWLECQN